MQPGSPDKKRLKRKRLTQYEWMKKHLAALLELKNKYLGTDTAGPQDVEYGFWSIKKLIAINYLVPQFGSLARTGDYSHCFYLDLLAGSGLVKLNDEIVMPGSAMVALAAETTPPHFEKYYFVEDNAGKADLLDRRLAGISKSMKRQYSVERGDCNAILPNILSEIYETDPERSCFLALFDPEGYTETAWDTLVTLLGRGKGDLIFNFTEGVARNVQKARTDPSYVPSLEKYFGDSEETWLHLDGYGPIIAYFASKLQVVNRIRRTVFRIDIRDEGNHPLYGLLIATGSTGYANIITDLKKRLDATDIVHLENIMEEIEGKRKPITSY
jgi:three-Cys-motif partner protein